MEKIVGKIGVGLDMACATMMFGMMIPLAKHFPMLAFMFFIGSLILWNEIIRDSKEGGAR
jgi:hypothetical protein